MDFVMFDSLISVPVLIGFYYIGAVVCPLVMWRCMWWLLQRYPLIDGIYTQGSTILWRQLPTDKRWKIVALFTMMFLFAELLWRLMFEFMIAFMQIRDALV